jgi:hypothetical protein
MVSSSRGNDRKEEPLTCPVVNPVSKDKPELFKSGGNFPGNPMKFTPDYPKGNTKEGENNLTTQTFLTILPT